MGFYKENLPQAIAEQLRAERAAKQLHIKQVAELTGLSERALIRYLNGEREITMDKLASIADALGVSPGDIVTRAIQRIE